MKSAQFSRSRQRKPTVVPAIAVLLVLLVTGCTRSPVSPPAARPGEAPEFDSLLSAADTRWTFVFADDFRITRVDAAGQDQGVLLDLREKTGKPKATFLGDGSISPDGRFILAAYYYSLDAEHSQPDAKLLLLDLRDLSIQVVPCEAGDFRLGWHDRAYWLDASTFLVPLNSVTARRGGGYAERVRYLRKQVDDLGSTTVVAFPTDAPIRVWDPRTSSLLFASEHELPDSWTVQALGLHGLRPATADEDVYFHRQWRTRGYGPACPVALKTERVVGDAVEGWGRYWEENWNRHWILLDGKKVRCSAGSLDREPIWDQELELLLWQENGDPGQVFVMDRSGHYRRWHAARYWGKLPKGRTASN